MSTVQQPLWEPSQRRRERANVSAFMRRGPVFDDYDALWRWSIADLEAFWAAIWDEYGVRASAPYERVLADDSMPGARWFTGARLNYAENLIERHAADAPALLHCSETRALAEVTWGELRTAVAETASGLRSLGVGRGDRVAAYMPNIVETLIAFLATASIGAVWSSAAPEFGVRSVIDRFAQIEPKVLLAVDGYRYRGRDHSRADALVDIRAQLPTVEHVVVTPYLGDAAPPQGAIALSELRRRGAGAPPAYEQVPFDHPLWVLYSSGTTGLPKPIVHGHGGILVEQLKKAHLHIDLHPGDRMFWFTTTGWMMWNMLVGCLLTDAAIVLYDGHPGPEALWGLAERAGVTCFGTSAGFIAACAKDGMRPRERFDLGALGAVGSTGSPLSPEGFRWVYDAVGSDVWLFSTSGGTDVCTSFLGGCPILPVHEGELQCRALGCDVRAFDEHGHEVVDEVGELVLCRPMPSMPIGFWNDPDGSRYRESYFDVYPGVWRHGDWVRITPRGGAVIYGRSDSTINRQGVRMGTSEIYRAVLACEDVLDALVVDVPRDGGDLWMALFVVLREGAELDDDLQAFIRARIRDDCSPRHVPDAVMAIDEVPRTLSGKILEVPVKRILMGADPEKAVSVQSLANPAALDFFVKLADHLP